MTNQNDLVFCPQSGESLAFFSSFRQLIHVSTSERLKKGAVLHFNLDALPVIEPSELMKIYDQTGCFFINRNSIGLIDALPYPDLKLDLDLSKYDDIINTLSPNK